ncbi:putative ent-kaurene synthase [Medicago truncatula]|uniref:Gibberellin 20-oxidase n=1 Tax=Medicago truncatula TaxID=3880 RepID=G7JC43_MEDTR|nr:gibberellin 20 oxidase 2 [Medicago truncatula]AES72892.2 gibberellin 20-oxidase [Medicago truncatula]RHN69958.1 putative ent-kaurene synthase [Medicago truncatula]
MQMALLMNSSTSTHVLYPALKTEEPKTENMVSIFDSNLLQNQVNMPKEFIWPSMDLVNTAQEELKEPLIDLSVMKSGDEEAIASAAELVRKACLKHGFFQVINHGVDQELINDAYCEVDPIFNLPINKKLSAKRVHGGVSGYSGAHADRYSSKLPWKETFSFVYNHQNDSNSQIVNYFKSVLGEDFQQTGWVYQKYCEAMKELSLVIMELLAISLGIDRLHYRRFFEDGDSIMRCNYYPPCKSSNLTLGTGPHSDPTSLTILHQDQVGGLEVFADNKWVAVRPRPEALVINIGDTFMALSNGRYKSCLHRALVNRYRERRSLVFFVCPREDKVVRPPENLLSKNEARKYPDFTWSSLFEFTQKHYRADVATLQSFFQWHSSCNL